MGYLFGIRLPGGTRGHSREHLRPDLHRSRQGFFMRDAPSGEPRPTRGSLHTSGGHSRRGDGVDHLQADLPEVAAVE
jgi:hypothetical protein